MKLTHKSEYGIQGLIHLAQHRAETVTQFVAIAEPQGLPQSVLAKIFQKFSQYGLVRSFRGDLHQPLSPRTLRHFIDDLPPAQALPASRLPGKLLVRHSELDAWGAQFRSRGRPSLARALRELGL